MERTLENLYIWKESRMVVNSIYRMLAQSNDWGFKDPTGISKHHE